MNRDPVVPTQGIRERHLNIVYFVDSSKSHSIRIHLTTARWLIALGVGVLLWSLISIGWIISLNTVLAKTRGLLSVAMQNVFDYQVKYERVFDKAYPDDSGYNYNAVAVNSLPHEPLDVQGRGLKNDVGIKNNILSNVTIKPEPGSAATSEQVAPKTEVSSAKNSEPVTQTADGLDMDIRAPSLSADAGKMTLLFDIHNRDTKKRAEGYIWATASLKNNDGTAKRIVAPAHAKIGKDGMVDSYTSTYKFNIQRFKRKDFTFTVPEHNQWSIENLEITYVDAAGRHRKTTSVNVPLKFKAENKEASPHVKNIDPPGQSESSRVETSH